MSHKQTRSASLHHRLCLQDPPRSLASLSARTLEHRTLLVDLAYVFNKSQGCDQLFFRLLVLASGVFPFLARISGSLPHTTFRLALLLDNNNNDTGVAFEANNSLSSFHLLFSGYGFQPSLSFRLPYWWGREVLKQRTLHTILYLLLFIFCIRLRGPMYPTQLYTQMLVPLPSKKSARSFPCISSSSHPHPHRSESRNGFVWLELSAHSLSPPTRDRSETCVHLFTPAPALRAYHHRCKPVSPPSIVSCLHITPSTHTQVLDTSSAPPPARHNIRNI